MVHLKCFLKKIVNNFFNRAWGKLSWKICLTRYPVQYYTQSQEIYGVVGRAYSIDIQVFAYNFHQANNVCNEK